MSYRSILVCLDDPAVAESVLNVASGIAAEHQAHLTAAYVVPPLAEYTALDLPVPQIAVDGFLGLHKKRASAIEKVFQQQTAGQNYTAEWRFIDTCAQPVDEAFGTMGNAFDLVVIGAGNTGQNAGRQHGIPDKVILSCSRPVLIVPSNTSESVSFNRVLIAYDQGIQSSRAIFNAMPVLQRAGSVTLQRINPKSEEQA
jgi:nucleotide-binding universal stress UspA family protein